MRMRFVVALLVAVTAWALQWVPGARADVVLGLFNFDSTRFGNTVTPSDGGAHANSHWLNVVDEAPSPDHLTLANFVTGIANLPASLTLQIEYGTPIVNEAGHDFGIVVARFRPFEVLGQDISIALSTDGGATFTADALLLASSAVPAGIANGYFYGQALNLGALTADLFVHSLDLSSFGLALGEQVNAIRVTGAQGLDLIRVAGFDRETHNEVPEPITLVLLGLGVSCAVAARRFRP